MQYNRYRLLPSNYVPNAGFKPIKVGLPVDREMQNTICITCDGSYEFVPLNDIVLRNALLRDPELTKQLLGIEVKDCSVKEEVKEPEVEKKIEEPIKVPPIKKKKETKVKEDEKC